MINKAEQRKKKSLSEKSMKLVVRIVKLSSPSLATLSLRTPAKLPTAERNHVPTSASGNIVAAIDVVSIPRLAETRVS